MLHLSLMNGVHGTRDVPRFVRRLVDIWMYLQAKKPITKG